MLTLGAIGFQTPWVLLALGTLPIIWYLIRSLPPKPREVLFPPFGFLLNLKSSNSPPDKAPWWILLLRLLIAALIIIALANPVYNPKISSEADGPLLLIIDNGWEVANDWDSYLSAADVEINGAARADKPIYILGTTKREVELDLKPLTPSEGRDRLSLLTPQPWSPSFMEVVSKLDDISDVNFSKVIWLSDGLYHPDFEALKSKFESFAPLSIMADGLTTPAMALLEPQLDRLDIGLTLVREARNFPDRRTVVALGQNGIELGRTELIFGNNDEVANSTLSLPQALRNTVSKLEVLGHRSAATKFLMDGSTIRPLVGITTGEIALETPPLKSSRLYLVRSLEGKAAVREGNIMSLLEEDVSILILANTAPLTEGEESAISNWVDNGGVLIRFPGEQTSSTPDSLLPVQIRSGDRSFGGSLSWDTPKTLAPFDGTSPFAGLEIPEDISIQRQLLASPSIDLDDKTWARLEDGTPLVTATTQNNGWLILFHTSANQDWSDMSLSGLFPLMLERLLPFANSRNIMGMSFESGLLPPQQIMDAFGMLNPPQPHNAPINGTDIRDVAASMDTPPGLYGSQGSPVAINLSSANGPIDSNFKFSPLEDGDLTRGFKIEEENPLKPFLLGMALILGLLDMGIGLWLRGMINKNSFASIAIALLIVSPISDGLAQETLSEDYALGAATKTRLAYVATGDPTVDEKLLGGLRKLGRVMRERTSLVLGDPVAVDPKVDAINLYPLIYWPVGSYTPQSDEATLQKISTYLNTGGMILFDTGVGDPANESTGLSNPGSQAALSRLLGGLELPSLIEVTPGHVLSKSYYLLNQFPGRLLGRPLWAERRSGGEEPSVTGIIIGSHDWASAWNNDVGGAFGRASGNFSNWQQEHAFRFGINLVMYALTGTYKNDNLHLDAILDRLVQ